MWLLDMVDGDLVASRARQGCKSRNGPADSKFSLSGSLNAFPGWQLRKTMQKYLAEYGMTFVVVYLVIFALVLTSFWLAIKVGLRTESTAGSVGALTAAYLATKVTQPLRIAGAVLITPIIVGLVERLRGTGKPPQSADPD